MTTTITRCAKGCDRPVSARGLCSACYQKFRHRQIALRTWHGRYNTLGTARRLQALVAIGYTQTDLCRRLGWQRQSITRLIFNRQPTVNVKTAKRVDAMFRQLQMTPGPSQAARNFAKEHKWAPPLAWGDDGDIDDPAAIPDIGEDTRLSFRDRYLEMQELGYREHEIAKRFNVKAASLMRQVLRHNIPVSRELQDLAYAERWTPT